MTHETTACQRKFSKISVASEEPRGDWEEKVRMVADFGESMRRRYWGLDDSEKPLEMRTKVAAEDIVMTMHLLLRRPPSIGSETALFLSGTMLMS